MATASPPLYFFPGIGYNDAFFNTNTSAGGGITQSYEDNQYLARVGLPTSRATTTTFLGGVNINGTLSALETASIVTTSQTTNAITTLGTTSSTQYAIPYVTSQTSAISQQLYTDSGTSNHLSYQPSTNTLFCGGTTNGAINVIGTASNISIAGTGTA